MENMMSLTDAELLRYSRQILVPEIDIAGQEQLCQAHVLIIGMGGLGCPAAMYLAAAGVGELSLADPDVIELSNLPRQILYRATDCGQPKVTVAATQLQTYQNNIKLHTYQSYLGKELLEDKLASVDVVIDATDNFQSRKAINHACHKLRAPLVSASANAGYGQLAYFDFRAKSSPCYQCLYPELPEQQPTCAQTGVLSPLLGMLGSLQAVQTIKLICNTSNKWPARMIYVDAFSLDLKTINLKKEPTCPCCS